MGHRIGSDQPGSETQISERRGKTAMFLVSRACFIFSQPHLPFYSRGKCFVSLIYTYYPSQICYFYLSASSLSSCHTHVSCLAENWCSPFINWVASHLYRILFLFNLVSYYVISSHRTSPSRFPSPLPLAKYTRRQEIRKQIKIIHRTEKIIAREPQLERPRPFVLV